MGKKHKATHHISSPITVQINNGSIKVNREVVNELRKKLKTKDKEELQRLENIVESIVPEVEPPASGDAQISNFDTIKADFATLKAEYERDRALAELEEVKKKLEEETNKQKHRGTGAPDVSVESLR